MRIPCRHCNTEHKYVCDCGRSHNDHTFGGGCAATGCEGYTQLHKRLPDESQKQYTDRILGRTKAAKAGRQ